MEKEKGFERVCLCVLEREREKKNAKRELFACKIRGKEQRVYVCVYRQGGRERLIKNKRGILYCIIIHKESW